MSRFHEKCVTDGRTDGQKDGQRRKTQPLGGGSKLDINL